MPKNTFRLRPPAYPPPRNRENFYTARAPIIKNQSRKIKGIFLYRMRRYIVKNQSTGAGDPLAPVGARIFWGYQMRFAIAREHP